MKSRGSIFAQKGSVVTYAADRRSGTATITRVINNQTRPYQFEITDQATGEVLEVDGGQIRFVRRADGRH